MTDIQKTLEEMRKKAEQDAEEIAKLGRLAQTYPDLARKEGRWGRVVYATASVNPLVDKFFSRYNCGCCEDSPYEVWPYHDTPDGPVSSVPACFFVADRTDEGALPREGWRADLERHHIPTALLDQIAQSLLQPYHDDNHQPADNPYDSTPSHED
jgi:hypothetical protein